MGFASIAKSIGKAILKGGKWALDHSGEIAQAAEAGATLYNGLKKDGEKALSEQEYYALLEEENANLNAVLKEINDGISELQNVFETAIESVEQKYEETTAELETLKEAHTKEITTLQNQLNQYKEENIALQNKNKKQFMILSIAGAIGIVVAILLAILF